MKWNLESGMSTTASPGAPDGECVVLWFNTEFARKAAAAETVTAIHEQDASCLVGGHFAR